MRHAITTADDDYVSVSETVTIPAGSTSVDVPVMINDDSVVENMETFSLSLSTSDPSVSVSVTASMAEVTIQDTTSEFTTSSTACD